MSRHPGKRGKSLRSIQSLMQEPERGFGKLLAHARELDRMDQQLASMLDPELVPHCQVAEFCHGRLVLVCSNATFAARIRMMSQPLLDSFREEGYSGMERVQVRIAPVNRPQAEVRQQRTLSPAAIQALGRFASDSGDADIQAMFEQIKARRNRQ